MEFPASVSKITTSSSPSMLHFNYMNFHSDFSQRDLSAAFIVLITLIIHSFLLCTNIGDQHFWVVPSGQKKAWGTFGALLEQIDGIWGVLGRVMGKIIFQISAKIAKSCYEKIIWSIYQHLTMLPIQRIKLWVGRFDLCLKST